MPNRFRFLIIAGKVFFAMSDFQHLLSKSHFWHLEDEIQEACQPFFAELGFNYFDYSRFYKNHTFVTFISDQQYSNFFLDYNKFEKHQVYKLPTTHLPAGQYLWSSYIDPAFLNLANQQFNHGLGVTLIRHHSDYVELANFAAPSHASEVLNIFLNHQELLDMFIIYFIEKFSHFLESKKNRILLPSHVFHQEEKITSHAGIKEKLFSEIKKLKKMGKKQVPIIIDNSIVALSLREMDCLNELFRGLTAKQIAKNLKISYRTVQVHSANLMSKMKVNKRGDLLNKIRVKNSVFLPPT